MQLTKITGVDSSGSKVAEVNTGWGDGKGTKVCTTGLEAAEAG